MTPEQKRGIHTMAALVEDYALAFASGVKIGSNSIHTSLVRDRLDAARKKLVDHIIDVTEKKL